jgi:hypothetical protein
VALKDGDEPVSRLRHSSTDCSGGRRANSSAGAAIEQAAGNWQRIGTR